MYSGDEREVSQSLLDCCRGEFTSWRGDTDDGRPEQEGGMSLSTSTVLPLQLTPGKGSLRAS